MRKDKIAKWVKNHGVEIAVYFGAAVCVGAGLYFGYKIGSDVARDKAWLECTDMATARELYIIELCGREGMGATFDALEDIDPGLHDDVEDAIRNAPLGIRDYYYKTDYIKELVASLKDFRKEFGFKEV